MMPLGHLGIPLLFPLIDRDAHFDIRLLVLGSILPDLIDKPLGHLILPENNGRMIAHTLMFSLFILGLGLMRKPMLSLSVGVTMHQLQDGMFMDPRTSLWPLMGPFVSTDFRVYQWFAALGDPYVIFEEVLGLIIIISFVKYFHLLDVVNLRRVMRTGRLIPLKNNLYKKDMK